MRKLFSSIENIDLNDPKYVGFFFNFVNSSILLLHVMFMVFGFSSGANAMGYFNIVSIALYLFGFYLIKIEAYTSHLIFAEIEMIAHAFMVSRIFSETYGFCLYLYTLVPFAFFSFYFARSKHIVTYSVIASVISAIAYNYCYYYASPKKALYPDIISESTANFLHTFNASMLFLIFTIFCVVFTTILYNFIGEIKNENVTLNDEASHDPLTGLNNRRLLDIEMDKKLHLFATNNIHFSILMCDIDDFKKVNDTYGHDEGDKVLIDVSNIIKDCTRPGDFLCRWGGEEFLIILMNASIKEASQVAYRIKGAVELHKFQLENTDINCTITIGVASSEHGLDKESMYELADARLYKGKQTGKNKVVSE